MASKCFERCHEKLIGCISNPAFVRTWTLSYHHNRAIADAISPALHSSLGHLNKKNTYIGLLFIVHSSLFNTIISFKHHQTQGIDRTLADRVNNFKFVTMHISEDLFRARHIDAIVKKAHPCLYLLKLGMWPNAALDIYGIDQTN